MQRDGTFKSWNSSIAKEQVWTDDGQQLNSFFAHLLTWALCYKTKTHIEFFCNQQMDTINSNESKLHPWVLTIAYGHHWSFALAPMWAKPIIVASFLHILLPSFMYNMLEWGLQHSWNSLCVCFFFQKKKWRNQNMY
jgi:hypothetical protein